MKKKYWVITLAAVLLLGTAFYGIGKYKHHTTSKIALSYCRRQFSRLTAILSYKIKLNHLDVEILRLLKDYSISKTNVAVVKEYTVKKPLDIERFRDSLKALLEKIGFKLLRYETIRQEGRAVSTFEIGTERRTFYILKLTGMELFKKALVTPRGPTAKIAIVIDDWGYNMNNIEWLDSINIPLTISILPGLVNSTRIAKNQHSNKNREIILHMPMEPEDKNIRLEKNTIFTTMDNEKILTLLRASLKTVPYAKGLSNHMGSKATQDEELVKAVMKELKQRRLYFLDSLATPDTVCQQGAADLKLKFAKRDIFLDNVADKNYISSQLDKLIRLARRKGFAVGVGHDRTLTLEVIREKTEQLKGEDIKFVFVSELAREAS